MEYWFRNKKDLEKFKEMEVSDGANFDDLDNWKAMPWYYKLLDIFLYEALGPLVVIFGVIGIVILFWQLFW